MFSFKKGWWCTICHPTVQRFFHIPMLRLLHIFQIYSLTCPQLDHGPTGRVLWIPSQLGLWKGDFRSLLQGLNMKVVPNNIDDTVNASEIRNPPDMYFRKKLWIKTCRVLKNSGFSVSTGERQISSSNGFVWFCLVKFTVPLFGGNPWVTVVAGWVCHCCFFGNVTWALSKT